MAEPDTTTPEIWRPIPRYEGLYSVSNFGQVRRDSSLQYSGVGRILRPGTNRKGYRYLGLCRDAKRQWFEVHRLVALAFLGPCPDGYCVNHLNADPADNRPENLEYCTRAENSQHAARLGLMPHGVGQKTAKLT